MGGIIFWTLVRTILLIPLLFVLIDAVEFKFWWIVMTMSIYGIIIHPAIVQYKFFQQKNNEVITVSLCSTCRHFDSTAVICMKYDKHPSMEFIPCEGKDWEFNKYAKKED